MAKPDHVRRVRSSKAARKDRPARPEPRAEFSVKDSGKRLKFASGMVRDVETDKTRFDLVADGPMLERWAVHLTKGAQKYSARNWMKADGDEEFQRFRASAFRHFIQWFHGETDEDHASALYFNVNGVEYVKEKQDAIHSKSST